jgi:hypothetical protein
MIESPIGGRTVITSETKEVDCKRKLNLYRAPQATIGPASNKSTMKNVANGIQ